MITALEEYFEAMLKEKKNIIRHVVHEFTRIYKAKDDNETTKRN